MELTLSVGAVTSLRAVQPTNAIRFRVGARDFLLTIPAVGPTPAPIQYVPANLLARKWPGREPDHHCVVEYFHIYRGADKSLARLGGEQATATEDFGFRISYL